MSRKKTHENATIIETDNINILIAVVSVTGHSVTASVSVDNGVIVVVVVC